jgi:hypothetical protein
MTDYGNIVERKSFMIFFEVKYVFYVNVYQYLQIPSSLILPSCVYLMSNLYIILSCSLNFGIMYMLVHEHCLLNHCFLFVFSASAKVLCASESNSDSLWCVQLFMAQLICSESSSVVVIFKSRAAPSSRSFNVYGRQAWSHHAQSMLSILFFMSPNSFIAVWQHADYVQPTCYHPSIHPHYGATSRVGPWPHILEVS